METIHEYSRNSLSLTDQNKFEGPDFKVSRPSMAIYDPSGISPINLQRSNVAFDRMGFDDHLGKDVLQRFMKTVIAAAPKELTIKSYVEYAEAMRSVRGVNFEHSTVPPICATNKGVFLATPRFFASLKIERLYFANADTSSTTPLKGILSDGDAIMFVTSHSWGEQATLSWFRSIFGSLAEAWRANSKGFPELQHVGELGIIKDETWKLANAKGKVAKQILKRLKTKSILKTMIVAQSNNITSTIAESHLLRIQGIFQKLGKDCEISVWLLQHAAKGENSIKSPLSEEWLCSVGAPLLAIP